MKPELTRSEYDAKMQAEDERLIQEREMPPLDKILAAIKDARRKYRQRIADERKADPVMAKTTTSQTGSRVY